MGNLGRSQRILFVVSLLFAASEAKADQTVTNPADGSPEAVLLSAFYAAKDGDYSKYLKAVHPDHKETARQRKERQKYEWTRFRTQYKWYLITADPISYAVVRRQEDGKDGLRLFIRDQRTKDRLPVPVRMKRYGARWGIVVSSL